MSNIFLDSVVDRYVEECGCVRFDSRAKANRFVSRMYAPLDWKVYHSGSFYYVVRLDRFQEILNSAREEVSFYAEAD